MNNYQDIIDVIRHVWDSSKYTLCDTKAITRIEEKPKYIEPKLKEIQFDTKQPIIIISAPGAVGKTTLAKYSANIKKGYYWDLSKLKLGSNSFVGTLVETFGPENIGQVLTELGNGRLSLFIDAFDEAEMISGSQGIETFLIDVYKYCNTASHPNIVLFSRSETTSIIQFILDNLSSNPSYSLFEIDYFEEENAIRFIKHYLNTHQEPDMNYENHSTPFLKALYSIFNTISAGMNINISEAWKTSESRTFLGYAPVLQTIGQYLHKQNYEQIAQQFESNEGEESGVKVIAEFIDVLLQREQKKVLTGIKERLVNKPNSWDNWSTIYSSSDQLKIIANRILNPGNPDLTEFQERLPDWLKKDFAEAIRDFIQNHPFLRGREFSSPAFRDYLLSHLCCDPNYGHKCLTIIQKDNIILSSLFANFYKYAHNSRCYGDHAGLLYESATSKLGLSENVLLTFIKTNPSTGYTLEILNAMANGKNGLVFDCTINDEHPLTFERRLFNATIDIDANIVLGRANSSIELCSADIRCQGLELRCNEVFFNCYNQENTTLVARECLQKDHSLQVRKSGDGFAYVNWPNSEYYPWSDFHNQDIKDIQLGYDSEIYALKRILSPFRKHKKEEFAKHHEFVDNRIIGDDPLRKSLLKYLLGEKIIYLNNETNMYHVSSERINTLGLTWSALKGDPTANNGQLLKFLEAFKQTKA